MPFMWLLKNLQDNSRTWDEELMPKKLMAKEKRSERDQEANRYQQLGEGGQVKRVSRK